MADLAVREEAVELLLQAPLDLLDRMVQSRRARLKRLIELPQCPETVIDKERQMVAEAETALARRTQ